MRHIRRMKMKAHKTGLFLGMGLLAALPASAAVFSGEALAADSSGVDIAELFYTYSGDNIVTQYYDPDEISSAGERRDKTYLAFLGLYQEDLDWNGIQELLAVQIRSSQENPAENQLVAEVYEYEGNKLQRVAQTELAGQVLEAELGRADVFVVNTDSGISLVCEHVEQSGIFSEEVEWNLGVFHYDGTQFVQDSRAEFSGANPEEAEVPEAWEALNHLGLYPQTLVGTAVADQVDPIQRICSVERYPVTDALTVQTFLDGQESQTMQYGETMFFSYVNQGLENKLPVEFVTDHGTAESAGQAREVSADGRDFVIPDSDSRLITEEDLNGLTEYEILLARNEIYARRGRIFQNEELSAYFGSKAWYQPTVPGNEFDENYAANVFNEFELRNIDTIVAYEKEHGFNQF